MDEYIRINILLPLKDLGYRDLLATLIIFTGGNKLLERYITNIANAKILDNCLFYNIEGARLLDTGKNRGNK